MGRACVWLLKNTSAGRDPKDNVFWRMQLPQMVKELRGLRDPNKQQVISDKPALTTEVSSPPLWLGIEVRTATDISPKVSGLNEKKNSTRPTPSVVVLRTRLNFLSSGRDAVKS